MSREVKVAFLQYWVSELWCPHKSLLVTGHTSLWNGCRHIYGLRHYRNNGWKTLCKINIYKIIQFVCLFVRNSRLNYAKQSHQRNYRNPPGRTTPRIGVTRHVVSMAFPAYCRYSLHGWPPYFNYHFAVLSVSTRACCYTSGVQKTNQYDTQYIHRQKDKIWKAWLK